MRKPSHIGQTIKEVFEVIDKTTTGTSKKDISSAWARAAGAKAAAHSEPAGLKNKTLLVSVDSTVWIYHLRLKKKKLLKKIGALLEGQEIEEIKFRAGQ